MSCCGPATASENSSLRSTSRLLEGLHENINLLVGNTRSSGTPALYAYSSCSASIKRRNGIATSHRELFHNRGGRRLLISNILSQLLGSTISRQGCTRAFRLPNWFLVHAVWPLEVTLPFDTQATHRKCRTPTHYE